MRRGAREEGRVSEGGVLRLTSYVLRLTSYVLRLTSYVLPRSNRHSGECLPYLANIVIPPNNASACI
jgi:hypothetical protein